MPSVTRDERAYEKHAWILLFLSSAIMLPLSAGALFLDVPGFVTSPEQHATWEEFVTQYPDLAGGFMTNLRLSGGTAAGFGIFGMAISAFSYRKGERWAWYVLWVLAAFYLWLRIQALGGGTSGAPFVFPILPLLGLLLPVRKFFPTRGNATSS